MVGYGYNGNANPGLCHTAPYDHDGVNRLTKVAVSGGPAYTQNFPYDIYGNLSCAPAGPGCVAFTYNVANNHIAGYTYDAAGNVTNDGTNTYQWDAEAHLIAVINGAGVAISTNTYNALGQRVRDETPTATTDEAYGGDGELLWRFTGSSTDPNQRAFVNFTGGILAEYYGGSPGGTIFDHPDELGSLGTSTSYNGSPCQEKLFYPFGELWTGAGSCGMHQEFAKLPDYDPETDEYNTLNRHYSPSGRWMSPDPGGVKVVKLDFPQTWNMYAYVENNPTTFTDPTGLYADPNPADTCSLMSANCPHGLTECAESPDKCGGGKWLGPAHCDGCWNPNVHPPKGGQYVAGNPWHEIGSAMVTMLAGGLANLLDPFLSRGGQRPKGERRITGKPEFKDKPGKLPKGVRPNPKKPGQYQVKDPVTGNWVDKSRGWSPYAQKVTIGAAIVTGAVIVGRAIAGCVVSGLCEAAAF